MYKFPYLYMFLSMFFVYVYVFVHLHVHIYLFFYLYLSTHIAPEAVHVSRTRTLAEPRKKPREAQTDCSEDLRARSRPHKAAQNPRFSPNFPTSCRNHLLSLIRSLLRSTPGRILIRSTPSRNPQSKAQGEPPESLPFRQRAKEWGLLLYWGL